MVPRQWIERAQQIELPEQTAPIFAIDVARHGGDETVIVRIAGGRARVVWAARGLQSIMPIAAHIEALSEAEPGSPPFWIDADGTGWGVFDRASELGLSVAAFQGGSALPTATGT